VREINAFALPGGPTYFNRGMIEAVDSEGEAASLMAHELSHVTLRHGTARASKATKYEVGALLGAVVGSIIGGRAGSVVSQGTQFGLGTRLFAIQPRVRAPAGSARVAPHGPRRRRSARHREQFKTIEKQGGGAGGPQWLSDHPNPGDRYEYITREAQLLEVRDPVRDTHAFTQAQARLRRMAPAPTTEEATGNATAGRSPAPDGHPADGQRRNIPPPSSSFTTYTEGNLFRVGIPATWRELPGSNAVTFAPEGGCCREAYGNTDGQAGFSHVDPDHGLTPATHGGVR
jgi:hypothetical protein